MVGKSVLVDEAALGSSAIMGPSRMTNHRVAYWQNLQDKPYCRQPIKKGFPVNFPGFHLWEQISEVIDVISSDWWLGIKTDNVHAYRFMTIDYYEL